MKKLYVLLGMMVFGAVASDMLHYVNRSQEPTTLTKEDRQKINIANERKFAFYNFDKMLDASIDGDIRIVTNQETGKHIYSYRIVGDWDAIFGILDLKPGLATGIANEYRFDGVYPLLCIAIKERFFEGVKILLEKYKVNPNVVFFEPYVVGGTIEKMTPLLFVRKEKLIYKRVFGFQDFFYDEVANLLIKYGAKLMK